MVGLKMILTPMGIYNLQGEEKYIQKQRSEWGGWEYGAAPAGCSHWSSGALVWAVSKFQASPEAPEAEGRKNVYKLFLV